MLSHVFQNEVSELMATIQAIKGAAALKALRSDVINLRSWAHVVTEAPRERSQKLQVPGTSFYEWNIVSVLLINVSSY